MTYDEKYMRRALEIARNGEIFASPNPMVGAVIVHDGKIIGEGFHRRCGEGHAEVNAVASVTQPELLPHSTIYVTLEPCSHYGKTPPCAQLIIDRKIPRVVIGCLDPFEKVSGRGVKMLREAGIEVIHGVMEDECCQLNAKFITAHTQRRPFITLKWAQSEDGFIDHKRTTQSPLATRFSTPVTSAIVHRLRATHDTILTGSGTVMSDNPSLNCRGWNGRDPQRVILDRKGIIPPTANVFNTANQKTLYFTSHKREDIPADVTQIEVPPTASLHHIMNTLYEMGITSVLVEGGGAVLQDAIDNNLWDIARVETAPFSLKENGGVKAPSIPLSASKTANFDGNKMDFYINNNLVQVKNL